MAGEGLGGGLRQKVLHFIWVADCSGSMAQDDHAKISSLNNAIRESIPVIRNAAGESSVRVMMRAIAFSTGFRWHIGTPTPVDEVRWDDLIAGGRTDLGAALKELAGEMVALERMAESGGSFVPPAIVLVSDGYPTDEFGAGLKALLETRWGSKSVRIAVGIGEDAHQETLSRFMGSDEMPVLGANQPDAIVDLLKWASTVAVARASSPPPTAGGTRPPPATPGGLGGRIWHVPTAGATQLPGPGGGKPPPGAGGTRPPPATRK